MNKAHLNILQLSKDDTGTTTVTPIQSYEFTCPSPNHINVALNDFMSQIRRSDSHHASELAEIIKARKNNPKNKIIFCVTTPSVKEKMIFQITDIYSTPYKTSVSVLSSI